MTPDDMIRLGTEIKKRWSDAAIIYRPGDDMLAAATLVVDHDEPLPHDDCDGEPDCGGCMGMYHPVAWVDVMGVLHDAHPTDFADIAVRGGESDDSVMKLPNRPRRRVTAEDVIRNELKRAYDIHPARLMSFAVIRALADAGFLVLSTDDLDNEIALAFQAGADESGA